MIKKLLDLGFIKISTWELIDENLHCDFGEYANHKDLLYSYVIDGEIVYIGQTIMELKKRLYGYKNPGCKQSTNIRINELIIKEIKNGNKVDVYLFLNDGSVKYKGYTINLAAGLENVLINSISPIWNIQSNKCQVQTHRNSKTLTKIQNNKDMKSLQFCEIILHKSYYGKGFFNLRREHSDFLSNETYFDVLISFGSHKVIAKADRFKKQDTPPRIRIGKEFSLWTTNNFELGDMMYVEFISERELKLSKKLNYDK